MNEMQSRFVISVAIHRQRHGLYSMSSLSSIQRCHPSLSTRQRANANTVSEELNDFIIILLPET